jgi:O-antigen/teichoic acid export membrane protein
MAKVSARGCFNLFWGLVASTVVSAVGVIVVARLLSPSEYGLVMVALTAPGLVTMFRDWGVNSAIVKYMAQYRSENRVSEVKSLLAAGLFFELVSGFFLSLILFFLSGFVAANIFNRPEITPLIQAASFTVFAGALLTASQSFFTGCEKMELTSITMVCQSVFKTVLAPLLIVLGLGAFGAILGHTISFLAAGLIGIMLLYVAIYRKLQNPDADGLRIVETVKTMLRYGLPLSISTILSGFLSQFYNFLVAVYCADALIGNYSVAANFAVLITFFSTPISTVLFPAFSKLNPKHEYGVLRSAFQLSVKYASLIVVPVAAAIMALSQPAVATLFGEKYSYAPLYLALLAINHLLVAFGSLSAGNLISSQGRTEVNMKLALMAAVVGLPLSLALIPRLGIIGLIVTTLTAGIPSLVVALWYVRKHYAATVDWKSSTKILSASILSALATHLILFQISLPSWVELIIGATAFTASYITVASLIGAVDRTDMQNVREMLKELGPFYNLLSPPLSLVEKLIRKVQRA